MNDRTKTITRRAALGTFAAAGAGYVAFGPKRSSSRREGNRVVLDYWEKWTGHEAAAMKEVVEAFNQSQNAICEMVKQPRKFSGITISGLAEESIPTCCQGVNLTSCLIRLTYLH